jgi:hypothetical protein
MNPVTHLYYRNLSQKLELQLESLQALHNQALNNLLEAELSQKTKDETKAMLDQMAKMDADRAARQAKVNPTTGKSYLDVANQATKDSLARAASRENYDELAKTAPNLAARARFGSESRAQSATPGAANGVAGQGGSTRYSDINAMSTLSAEDQARVAPTLSTKRLEDMRAAQYSNSQDAVRQGRGGAALGASKVSALNTINSTLDSRKNNAMGGQAAAGSFARSWQEDPTSLRTQRSMAVRTDREKLTMNDAMYQEGLRQFKKNGKLDPKHVAMVNQFGKFNSNQKEPNSTSFGSNQIIPSYNTKFNSKQKIDSLFKKPSYNPFVDTRYNPNLDPESVSYDDGIDILPQEKEDVPKGLIPRTPKERKMLGLTPYDMRRS